MKNLMEVAMDILTKSQSSAEGAPMEKPKDGEPEDKTIKLPDGTPGETAKEADAPGKPAPVGSAPMEKSDAKVEVVKEEDKKEEDEKEKKDGEENEDEEKDEKEKDENDEKKEIEEDEEEAKDKEEEEKEKKDEKEAMKEDVKAILSAEKNLSEDFKSKIATIYEARIQDKVLQIETRLNKKYTQELTEVVHQLETQLTEKIDGFLGYVVEEWMAQNEVAIEKSLRSELTEEFIAGLRNLFAEHYISVPEEKVELVDELAEKIEKLETELNETVSRNVSMSKQIKESKKQEVIGQVCDGLTQTQTEKIRSLVESAEFATEGEFQKKVETIRENYFPTTVKPGTASMLSEQSEEEPAQKEVTDSRMKAYMQAITKTLPK